ncbi:LOW QUALITY PROTEIN: hypothetical protein Cgig2_021873 [Carnegiea gigantea]|uniref:Uncharacterized protein n=1 Tax=Carnegiea gigantea TaxID=171969 RepID=A0A9Q1GPM9_9CARY|nr:LOW QUALITY PROTEIN: hypothetical protein Cgig2_021873 [Carnegiea gigantea]
MWERNSNDEVSIAVEDMFVDKDQRRKVANQLLTYFKANPTVKLVNIQKLIMKRCGVVIPRHTCEYVIEKRSYSSLSFLLFNMVIVTTGRKLHLYFEQLAILTTNMLTTRGSTKEKSVDTYHWLLGDTIEHWATYTFAIDLKCPNNTTNFMETCNEKIELFSYKPLFMLLEEIRRKSMNTIASRCKIAKTWTGHVVPRVKILLTKTKVESMSCISLQLGEKCLKCQMTLLYSYLT